MDQSGKVKGHVLSLCVYFPAQFSKFSLILGLVGILWVKINTIDY